MLGAAFLVACTSAHPETRSDGSPRSPASPAPRASPSAGSGRGVFVRTCGSSVSGDLGAGWRRGEVTAGPVVFVAASSYADDPAGRFGAPGRLATSQKVLIVVDGDEPVVVSVRHPDAALAYDPARWRDRNIVPFRLGETRVGFEPCDDRRSTQFNGAFLLRGPACAPVVVRQRGAEPVSVTISFGAGDCG